MNVHPLVHLRTESFGALHNVDAELSPQLNVVLGNNGSGKTQLLKLMYSLSFVLQNGREENESTKKYYETQIAKKLMGVFRPDSLGRLVTRTRGRARCQVEIKYGGAKPDLVFNFSTNSQNSVVLDSRPQMSEVKNEDDKDRPVFLPSHELISIYPGFVSLFDNYDLEFDETWRDTASLLGKKLVRGRREKKANEAVAPLERILGGNVYETNGRFYIKRNDLGNFEAHLLADGERKLAEVARLIATGTLLQNGYLFWDEPDAGLNPSTQRAVVETILHLARSGTQVFIATHSLFLLRELALGLEGADTDVRYIGLPSCPSDREIRSVQREIRSVQSMDDLDYLAALDAEAQQEERYFTRMAASGS